MRRAFLLSGLLFLLVLAYVLWPVAGFYQLAAALEAKDAQALSKLVDFPALAKSLTKQFVHAYLEISNKKREKAGRPQLTLIERSVAIGVGTGIAEPIVSQLVNEKTLLQLLTEGRLAMPGAKDAKTAASTTPAPPASAGGGALARHVWQLWLSSEYRGSDVYVRLPPGKPRTEQFRAKLSLADLRWKLADLELPETVLARSVKDIIAEHKRKSADGAAR